MKPNARDLARQVLRRVDEGAYATLALSGEIERANLSHPDRALATEIVYGVLRLQRRLDFAIASQAPRGIAKLDARVLEALRIGAYQILFMRVPSHAAVDDAVNAVKRVRGATLAGFVNALLRRLSEKGEPTPPADLRQRLGIRCSAPDWLVDRALEQFEPDQAERFLESLNTPSPFWIRLNPTRGDAEALTKLLKEERPWEGFKVEPGRVEVNPGSALRISGEEVLHTRAFAEGLFSVQDLAAQWVGSLLGAQPSDTILDACGGVGGKATQLAELTADRAKIDSADLSERKLELGKEQARRLGLQSIRFVTADLTRTNSGGLAESYDRVLLDAPCSGLGVLRRHPEAKWRSAPNIASLAELQAKILRSVARRVRLGGVLVYSVCTFTQEEGPAQIERFLRENPAFEKDSPPIPAELIADGALRTWPHRHDADGFYAARLVRKRS